MRDARAHGPGMQRLQGHVRDAKASSPCPVALFLQAKVQAFVLRPETPAHLHVAEHNAMYLQGKAEPLEVHSEVHP